MQEVTTKIQEQGGLQLSQVSLSMVKNSCKCGHDLRTEHTLKKELDLLRQDFLENINL